MLERLPSRVLVDPIVDLAVIGHPQLAEGRYRAERRILRAEIRPADIHHVHQIAQSRRDALQVRQRDLALAPEHGGHVIPPRATAPAAPARPPRAPWAPRPPPPPPPPPPRAPPALFSFSLVSPPFFFL